MDKYEIIKIFNNNVVLAKKNNLEYILIEKGLGFGRKSGDIIDKNTFEKVFVVENEINKRFKELTNNIESEIVGICEEVIGLISSEYDILDREIHIKLVDHIAFAIKRIKEDDEIENPFITEIETLYERDYEVAKRAVELIEKRLNIEIPQGEVGFIALHINAARNRQGISDTIKCAYICNSITEILEDELKIEINRHSIDYARFVTHIKFAIHRIKNRIPIKNELKSAIKRKYKESYNLGKIVAKFMQDELGEKISEDEVTYLAMHIEKLKNKTAY